MTERTHVVVTDCIKNGVTYSFQLAGAFMEIKSGFVSSTKGKIVFLDEDGNKMTALILTPYEFKNLKLKGEVHWDVCAGNPPDKRYQRWISAL